jgi:hypothetical protein
MEPHATDLGVSSNVKFLSPFIIIFSVCDLIILFMKYSFIRKGNM